MVLGMVSGKGVIADDHTKQEEAEGKAVWEKFQAKETACADLSEEDYGALGEYFMGLMLGDSHPAMNAMMIQMMGEDGEEAMHIAMGKRFSGCDSTAAFPAGGVGFMPMMNMMGTGLWDGFGNSQRSGLGIFKSNSMMWGTGLGFLGGLAMVFVFAFWILVILALVAIVRWLFQKTSAAGGGGSADEVLKMRYAKGEIDRKEFEERMKDIKNA